MMYTEYNEACEVVRVSKDVEMLIKDVREFGGCIVDENNAFIGGAEWVYESYLSDESKYVTCTDEEKCGDGTPYAQVGREIFEQAKNRNIDDWKPCKEVLV